MTRLAFAWFLLASADVYAGQLGTLLPWISGATAEADFALNNDDYRGEFADNPNKFKLNEEGGLGANVRQSIVDTERVIATIPSGGITEYAMTLGGGYSGGDAGPGVTLDSMYQIQLGFGTGDSFVRARDVAPELRFDLPDLASPAIEDYFFPIGDIPILHLVDHQGDTLIYQGSSSTGAIIVANFSSPDLFMLPLDIPDLPSSVRELYSLESLEGFAANDIPFTIRVRPVVVPEPSAWALSVIVCILVLAWRISGSTRSYVARFLL